ncbi:MAG: globin domain-containing protein [Myxococcota bacterium]
MLTEAQRKTIIESWRLAEPLGETVADLFYKRLFDIAPQYRHLFEDDLEPQKRKLIGMIRFMVKSCDWTDNMWGEAVDMESDLFLVVLALGRRHSDLYHVPDEAYEAVGEALIWTLDYGLGEAFTEHVSEAWVTLYTRVSQAMKMGRFAVGQAHVERSKEVSHG